MKDTLIINGITYVAQEPPKEEPKRIEGWIVGSAFRKYGVVDITADKLTNDDTKLVELKSNERILSRDAFSKAWDSSVHQEGEATWCVSEASSAFKRACKVLGFDDAK